MKKSAGEKSLGEKCVGEMSMGEKSVGEEFLGEKCMDEKVLKMAILNSYVSLLEGTGPSTSSSAWWHHLDSPAPDPRDATMGPGFKMEHETRPRRNKKNAK